MPWAPPATEPRIFTPHDLDWGLSNSKMSFYALPFGQVFASIFAAAEELPCERTGPLNALTPSSQDEAATTFCTGAVKLYADGKPQQGSESPSSH